MAAMIDIEEIRRDPLRFLRRAQAGETIIVTDANETVAEIKPVSIEGGKPEKHPRPFGLAKGAFTLPADFDAPLPEEFLNSFEN
jgi:antitoxin (DNA-binding transcriptional repressor) of toxin-antitoxin stability system